MWILRSSLLPTSLAILSRFRLIFADGACTNNGQHDALSGIGIALGIRSNQQFIIPITNKEDPGQRRSNQRAELLAALEGVRMTILSDPEQAKKRLLKARKDHFIIATDSEYVVKGITKWFPTWKANNWLTSSGKQSVNLDLFLQLDALITEREAEDNVVIGFWHVPRELNTIADGLAREAARLAGDYVRDSGLLFIC